MFDDLNPKQNTAAGSEQRVNSAPQADSQSRIDSIQPTTRQQGENVPTPNPAPVKKHNELEDIFSETEKSGQASTLRGNADKEKPEAFQPKTQNDNSSLPEIDHESKKVGKIIMMIVLLVALGGVGFGGYWAYANLFSGEEKIDEPQVKPNNEIVNEKKSDEEKKPEPKKDEDSKKEPEIIVKDEEPEVDNSDQNDIPSELPPIINETDTDKDGLLDQEEIQLGTDINSSDSDDDNLSDRQEVKVYKTNPLNPDTDGDSFLDGDEIKAGYNPNGPGKLLNIEEYLNNKNDQ